VNRYLPLIPALYSIDFFTGMLTLDLFPVVEKLELNKLRSLKSHGGVDRALLSFDLKVDLTPAFHWNIKQLFIYVVAVYETKGRFNQVVLWDKIIEASDPKVIDETNVFVKYALVDHGDELRGKNVTLQLQWDHMPITGLLHMDMQPLETASKFDLPEQYQ
jgi:signal peptidase complex subunit 3